MADSRLKANPFYVLGVSLRSTPKDVVEAAEARALEVGSEASHQARSVLIHPKLRLGAEVRWFPGVAPARSRHLVDQIHSDLNSADFASLPPIAIVNLVGELICLRKCSALEALRYLPSAWAAVDVASLLDSINEERAVAGIAPVPSYAAVEAELAAQHEDFAELLTTVLFETGNESQILAAAIEEATANGNEDISTLMEGVVDRYTLRAERHLSDLRDNVTSAIASVRLITQTPDGTLPGVSAALKRIEVAVKKYDVVAQPVQMILASKGLEHAPSVEVAAAVRSLAVDLANEHGLHNEAKQLSEVLGEAFKEVPKVAEMVGEDIETLDTILSQKEAASTQEKKRRKELTFHLQIGQDVLHMDPDVISYQGQAIATGEVDRVRWGVFKQYTNGIRTSRSFKAWVGTPAHIVAIECVRFMESEELVTERFGKVIDGLWKLVGSRLAWGLLQSISAGSRVSVGDVRLDKNGLWLTKRVWFKTEWYHAPWEELQYSSSDGALVIRSQKECKASARLSYRDTDNTHVLENLLEFLFKDGNFQRLHQGTLLD